MKQLPDQTGRFSMRLWFEPGEIDQILAHELRQTGHYPTVEQPAVDIEAFVERRLRMAPEPADLPEGVLGLTRFDGPRPVIFVSRSLMDGASADKLVERRLRSTLAHEAGHALLHPLLFEPRSTQPGLFGSTPSKPDAAAPVLCRDVTPIGERRSGYHGDWCEYQANVAIGALLAPRDVFLRVFEAVVHKARVEASWHRSESRPRVARDIADLLNVSREVVNIRLDELAIPFVGQEVLPAVRRR
jgi:hypothetical protein